MVFVPESLQERFIRVSREQKRTLVVCADDFRCAPDGTYGHEGDMGVIGWRMAERVFEELLPSVGEVRALAGAPGAGKSTWLREHGVGGVLYLDAVLARRATRRTVCKMAAAAGRQIDCVLFLTDLEICLARNSARRPDRVVPESRVRAAHRRLLVCPPGLDEGWRRVVRIEPDPTALRRPLDSSRGRS